MAHLFNFRGSSDMKMREWRGLETTLWLSVKSPAKHLVFFIWLTTDSNLNCFTLKLSSFELKRTNTMFIGRSLSTGQAMCWKVNRSGKNSIWVPNMCQNRRPYRTQTLFQFSASQAPILGKTENATFVHFMKKSMHLKTGFLSDYQVLFLLLNGPQIKTSL